MKLNKALLATLASGVATCLPQAETITADTADASARSNGGTGQITNSLLFAGSYYDDGPGISPIFPFQLPDLGEGSPFTSATLTLELDSLLRAPLTFNGDIIGLERVADSPNIIGDDWGSEGALLHDDFYTPLSLAGVSTTDDFTAWLNAQYANGANAGRFVFIRVDANIDDAQIQTGRSAFSIVTADHLSKQKPTIDFTIPTVDTNLAITDTQFNLEENTITLTWNKSEAASYIVTSSRDMIDWSLELDDGLDDDRDENLEDENRLTVTFSLADFAGQSPVFFRVQEQE